MSAPGNAPSPWTEGAPGAVRPDVPADLVWARGVAADPWPTLAGPLPPAILRLHGILDPDTTEHELTLRLDRHGWLTIPIDPDTWDVYQQLLTLDLADEADQHRPAPLEVVLTLVLEDGRDHLRGRVRIAAIASPLDLNRGLASWPPEPLSPVTVWGPVTHGPAAGHVPQYTAGYDQRLLHNVRDSDETRFWGPVGAGTAAYAAAQWLDLDQVARAQLADDVIARHPILHVLDSGDPAQAVWPIRQWVGDLGAAPDWHPQEVNVWRHLLEHAWGVPRDGGAQSTLRAACVERALTSFPCADQAPLGTGPGTKVIGTVEHFGAVALGGAVESAWTGRWLAEIAYRLHLPIDQMLDWFEAGFIDPLACAYLARAGANPAELAAADRRWSHLLVAAPGLLPAPTHPARDYTSASLLLVPDDAMPVLAAAVRARVPLPVVLAQVNRHPTTDRTRWLAWPDGPTGQPTLVEVQHPIFDRTVGSNS